MNDRSLPAASSRTASGPAARLQDRIVVFFVVLLMAVLLASFALITYTMERAAKETLRGELDVSARVFRRLLQQNSADQLVATSVLAYDFGFREAIASRDRDTIFSALVNHAARIRASGMAVIGLDGVVVTDTLAPKASGQPYAFPDLVNDAANLGRASAIRLVEGRAYQIIVVPVLAPLPIAWVSMSFAIDDDVARDRQRLTSTDVTFVDATGAAPRILATTVPTSRRADLLARLPAIIERAPQPSQARLAGEDFEILALPLDDTGQARVFALLQRSVEEGLEPYKLLQVVLLFLAAFGIGITLLGAIRIARRVTRPIAHLAAAAREIQKGNYDVQVDASGGFEIRELARAFDGMTRGLAERDAMRDALGKVASVAVVDRLLKGEIELGGAEVMATVLFTDVRNFTALAEKLTPTQSLQLLNEFLTEISHIVEQHEGIVDKYMGDGVMAVFGAPVPQPDDAARAVRAALAVRDVVREVGARLAARGMPSPMVGCGLNTSQVIAGNIGSPTRLNYTVLGDGVNLASRLEGLTKRYHVPIVAGSRTREAVPGVVWRELDKVRVRGRANAERIYEPLGPEGSVGFYELDQLEAWHSALANFRDRRWIVARAGFETLSTQRGYERLCEIYLDYLREFEQRAPGPDWDGAFTLYEK